MAENWQRITQMSADSADGDLDNLYAYIHREHVWGVNVAPPEDARRVIKPWDARMSHVHASSGVDDQMIFNIPFTLPVRVRAVVLNTGSGDFAPQRCSIFVNRPNGIDFGDVDAATEPSRDSRNGALPGSGQPQADFALLDGFHIYPVSASRFMHTNSVSIFFVRPATDSLTLALESTRACSILAFSAARPSCGASRASTLTCRRRTPAPVSWIASSTALLLLVYDKNGCLLVVRSGLSSLLLQDLLAAQETVSSERTPRTGTSRTCGWSAQA